MMIIESLLSCISLLGGNFDQINNGIMVWERIFKEFSELIEKVIIGGENPDLICQNFIKKHEQMHLYSLQFTSCLSSNFIT